MRTDAEKLLYEAIVELEYVHSNPLCTSNMCTSSVGQEIVERGMKLLGVADLGAQELEDA